MRSHREVLAMVLLLTMVASLAIGQDWTPTSAPKHNWNFLASSADGGRLFASEMSYPAFIYTSTNFGSTWTPTGAPSQDWGSLACSADGTILVAENTYGFGTGNGIYVSTNTGASWDLVFSPSNHWWNSVACSADGKKMVAASGISWWATNAVYISTNSGVDWAKTSAPNGEGNVTSTADGSRLAIATRTSVDVSTNFGLTWTSTYPAGDPTYPLFVTTSGNGTTLLALSAGLISTSSDWGATWKAVGSLTNYVYTASAACSADGVILAAAESSFSTGSRLLLSTNSGASWSATELPSDTNLCSVACSVDGSRVAAGLGHTFFPGPSFYVRQTTPVPLLKILSGPGSLALSWLLPSEPFVLEESRDLLTWSQVGATPTLNYTNQHYVVNLPVPIAPKFYRLVSQ